MRVTVANVTQHHSYQAALAAEEGGSLRRLVTTIYNKPGAKAHLLESILARSGNPADVRKFRARRLDGIPDSKVTTIMWPEIAAQTWDRAKFLHRLVPADSIGYLRSEAFDRQVAAFHVRDCDLFHGFEQCSEFSLRAARSRGIVSVLDQPVIHRSLWQRLEADEWRKLGLEMPEHSSMYWHHIDRKYRELDLADYLFVNLEFVRQSFIDEGFPEDRIFLIPYGVDLSAYPAVKRPERPGFNVLFVGQISWYKGLHYLLDAFERLDVPEAKLTVIGLPDEDWSEFFETRLAGMIKQVDYRRMVPHSDMPGHFEKADVFAFPSLGGGIGFATFEAMASGLPVITSDGDVVIRDGKDGLVVPPASVDDWVDALTRLAGDRGLRAKLGNSAAKRAREFTWEKYRQGALNAYREISQREGFGSGTR